MWFGALPSWAEDLADGLPLSVWPHEVRVKTKVANKLQHAGSMYFAHADTTQTANL